MHIDYDLLRTYSKIQDILLECGAIETTVAGGAVRDMLLEKPIKDIDVFYVGELDEVQLLKSFEHDISKIEHSEYEQADFYVKYARLTYKDCPYPIQLIKVDVAVDKLSEWILESFGCNLCKVSFGRDLELTQEFLDDVEMEILTFPKPVPKKFMDKMSDKYPDFLVSGEFTEEVSYECTDF